MKFKKLILSLGTVAAVAAPIATVISCGGTDSTQYSELDLLKMSNLKSSEAHSKLQDLWLAKVLSDQYGIKDKTPLEILTNLTNTGSTDAKASDFENDFKNTLIWVLKNKLFTSKDALSSIYQSLKSNAPDSVILAYPTQEGSPEKHAIIALNKKIFDRTNIHAAVTDVLQGVEWKDIFYNYSVEKEGVTFNPSILGIKDLILKMMVTKKYLALSSKDFKASLPEDYDKLASKYKDAELIDETKPNFPLVVAAMNSRLAYKTSIELDASKSRQYIISNVDNNLTKEEVKHIFNSDESKFKDKLSYSLKSETRVDEILAKIPGYTKTHVKPDKTVGFKGLDALPSGDDNLDTDTVSAIKLANTSTSRDGFIVDSKLLTDQDTLDKDPTTTKIRFTDEDKTKVELNYYTSLMPTYNDKDKTLEFLEEGVDPDDSTKTIDVPMSDTHLDILMNEAYTKDATLYSEALKYFTEKTDPIKITVQNEWARNYYVDEGLKYIDDEK